MSGGTPVSSERLAKLARVATVREERALRAWREAARERDVRASEQAIAEHVHRQAAQRAGGARIVALSDPCSEQAWVWTAATRAACDGARVASVEAVEALDEATGAAARSRDDYRRSRGRKEAVDDRLVRACRAERGRAEDRQAEKVVAPPRAALPRDALAKGGR